MQTAVLAGGYATSLWPITRHHPKVLLQVGGTTVIGQILWQLESQSRIDGAYISKNERFADDFETHLADSSLTKPQLSIEETLQEYEKLDVIGALAQLVRREGIPDEGLLVVTGDNLISSELSELFSTFEQVGEPFLAAYDIGSERKASQYGVAELDRVQVVNFEEKPESPSSSLVSIACYAFPASDIRFEEYLEDDNNPDQPGWFLQWLQERRAVQAFTSDGAWFDIGTPEGYLNAASWALDGDTVVAPDATVENSELAENVHVMSNANVTDSTLERTIVFVESTIDQSDLRASIVDRQAVVRELDLKGALVGAHSQLP